MLLSTTKKFNQCDASITIEYRNNNDYDIIEVGLEKETESSYNFIDVTDLFSSDIIITEIFGEIDWELVYRENEELI
jgi:hypothetical protein